AWVPGRIPDDLRGDARDAVHLADGRDDPVCDDPLHWAARGRERMGDPRDVAFARDVVDEAEGYDVEPELRIDHGAERGPDGVAADFNLWHQDSLYAGRCAAL